MKNTIITIIITVLVIALATSVYLFFFQEDFGGDRSNIRSKTKLLIGTGDDYTGDIVHYNTSSPATYFQFASSSAETYWDTLTSNWPQLYGATPTAAFRVEDAELVTFNFIEKIRDDNIGQTITCEFAQSNEDGCDIASSTLNIAHWLPIPIKATSSSITVSTASTTASSATSAIGEYEWAITFDDINYRCMQLKCYNASTTADNLLHVEATINY